MFLPVPLDSKASIATSAGCLVMHRDFSLDTTPPRASRRRSPSPSRRTLPSIGTCRPRPGGDQPVKDRQGKRRPAGRRRRHRERPPQARLVGYERRLGDGRLAVPLIFDGQCCFVAVEPPPRGPPRPHGCGERWQCPPTPAAAEAAAAAATEATADAAADAAAVDVDVPAKDLRRVMPR